MSEPQSFVVGEPITVEWAPWSAIELAQRQLAKVEIELDVAPMTDAPPLSPIPSDAYRYRLPQARLTIGTHAARGRVVRTDGVAGEWSEIVFQVTPIAPGLLREFRLTRTSIPVTAAQGADMAHAYSTLAIGRKLTDPELIGLAERYHGPQTRGGVLAFLDDELVRATT